MSYVKFSGFDFKWSDHIIDAYTYIKSKSLAVSHFKPSHFKPMIYIYHGSENCKY